MLETFNGRVYDGCCGSGGMFVQSEKFVEEYQGNIKDLSIYGQESNPTTLRLAKMNLAIRGIDAKIELGNIGLRFQAGQTTMPCLHKVLFVGGNVVTVLKFRRYFRRSK